MNVYDFDNTIYDGESCLDMFFYLAKKDKSLIKFIPRMIRAFSEYKKGRVTLERALEEYTPQVEKYLQNNINVLSDTSDFWDKHQKKIKKFYFQLQKPDDVILTAAPEISVNEMCKRLGISTCIGSIINPQTGKIERFNLRQNKVKSFFEAFPDTEIEAFYTDSPENDGPIIDIAKSAYIVKGEKITKVK